MYDCPKPLPKQYRMAAKKTLIPILSDTTSSKTSRLQVAVTPLGSVVGKHMDNIAFTSCIILEKELTSQGVQSKTSRWQGHLP